MVGATAGAAGLVVGVEVVLFEPVLLVLAGLVLDDAGWILGVDPSDREKAGRTSNLTPGHLTYLVT